MNIPLMCLCGWTLSSPLHSLSYIYIINASSFVGSIHTRIHLRSIYIYKFIVMKFGIFRNYNSKY